MIAQNACPPINQLATRWSGKIGVSSIQQGEGGYSGRGAHRNKSACHLFGVVIAYASIDGDNNRRDAANKRHRVEDDLRDGELGRQPASHRGCRRRSSNGDEQLMDDV